MTENRFIRLLIEKRGTSTFIGGAIGILTIYILWSREILKEPNLLVYASVFVVFSAIGGLVDYYQSKLTK